MAMAIFIVGLAGSGKTTLAHCILRERPCVYIDEGFWDDKNRVENCTWLINHLRLGHDCIVTEGAFMFEPQRNIVLTLLKREVPEAAVVWKCFENDQQKATINLLKRPWKDPQGHIEQNKRTSPLYTYPAGADILPIPTA